MDLKVFFMLFYLLCLNVYLPDAICEVFYGACVTVITQQNLCLFEDYMVGEAQQ